MKRMVRHRPSGAMVVAIVALVFAVAGTAGAAGLITGRQVKNNTISSSDIKNNTVRSKDVRNHSLLGRDFKPGQLPAGAPGPKGDTGPRGLPGARGLTGAPGPSTLRFVAGPDTALGSNSGDAATAVAECPDDALFPVGGGVLVFDTQGTADLSDDTVVEDGSTEMADSSSDPFGDTTPTGNPGWVATVKNDSNPSTNLVAVATTQCVDSNDVGLAAAARARARR